MRDTYRRLKESDSILETLRIERTNLNQKDFAKAVGIPLKTYQRWVSGETIGRPTLGQLKNLCRILSIEKIDELPDDFAEKKKLIKNNATKK